MEAPDFMGRSSDRTLEQIANPTLQDLVGRQPDRILDLTGPCRASRVSASRFPPLASACNRFALEPEPPIFLTRGSRFAIAKHLP